MTTTRELTLSHASRRDDHHHQLELQTYNKRFTCDGCKEQGFGSRYKCDHCNYELHKECNFPKLTISHDFFRGCTFEFCRQPRTKCGDSHCSSHHGRCCDACGKDVCGFVYHCRSEGWDLHPCCSNLESKLSIDGTDFFLRDQVLSRCLWCKKKWLWGRKSRIPGWSYVSSCDKYHFHVHCVSNLVHEAWKKGGSGGGDAYDSSVAMLLEKMELRAMAKSERNGGGGRSSKMWKIVSIFLKTIMGILLGDPITLACTVGEFLFT